MASGIFLDGRLDPGHNLLRQAVSSWQFQCFCGALARMELPTLEEIGIELVAVAGRTGPQTPPTNLVGRTEAARYGSNNHQFIPLAATKVRNNSFARSRRFAGDDISLQTPA